MITKICHVVGVPEEHVDYMELLYPAQVDITQTNGPDTEFGPTLTTPKHQGRDELIVVRMYGLDMLRHQNGYWSSTDLQLGKVKRRYLLNDHVKALLGIGHAFHELVNNDIPTDEENVHTSLDVESELNEEVDPNQAGDKEVGVMQWSTDQGVFSPYLLNYSEIL